MLNFFTYLNCLSFINTYSMIHQVVNNKHTPISLTISYNVPKNFIQNFQKVPSLSKTI